VVAEPLFKGPTTRRTAEALSRAPWRAASHHLAAGRARSHREFTARIGDALGDADETLVWLERLLANGAVPAGEVEPVLREAREIVSILTKSYQTSTRNDVDARPQARWPPMR
jgi:hypothetical protein